MEASNLNTIICLHYCIVTSIYAYVVLNYIDGLIFYLSLYPSKVHNVGSMYSIYEVIFTYINDCKLNHYKLNV